jgi:HPt (histidine-containing phosphotransfer) domain-containing protein
MDDYVGKPIDPDALNAAITRSLDGDDGRVSRDTRPPLLDRSTLDELCEGDPEMHQRLISLFAEQSASGVADIGRAIQANDHDALRRDAHHLKGSSASVGALRMAELCERLCQAREVDLPSAGPLLFEELEQASKLTSAAWNPEPSEDTRVPSSSR